MKLKLFKTYLLLIAIVLCFITCKKYPESDLWFKDPKQVRIVQGYMTTYKVNGIDSLDLLNAYFNYTFLATLPPSYKIKTDLRNTYITYSIDGPNSRFLVGSSSDIHSREVLTSENNKVKIDFRTDAFYYKKNIFIDKNTEWQIIYLCDTEGSKRKIRTTLSNGNTYEIQFD